MKGKIATTPYVAGQKYFWLPLEAQPEIDIMVFNRKKGTWERRSFEVVLQMSGKKLKTDETIKIYF